MNTLDILKGHLNEALGSNQELSEERKQICKDCPLLVEKAYGNVCNNSLFLNPKTNEVSAYPKSGYFKGCGCRLNAKTTLKGAKCPAGKW